MSVAGDPGGRAEQMRQKVQDLQEAAERATDPDERRRLQDQARRLRAQSNDPTGGRSRAFSATRRGTGRLITVQTALWLHARDRPRHRRPSSPTGDGGPPCLRCARRALHEPWSPGGVPRPLSPAVPRVRAPVR
jgi:hypothetical protein